VNIGLPIAVRAAREGASIALVLRSGATISYAALDASIRSVAARLRNAGIRRGMVVALDVTAPRAALVAILAIARLGAAAASMALSESAASIVLADRGALRRRPWIPFEATWLDQPPPGGEEEFVGGGEEIAVVHASSGTTGKPKGVAVSHALLAARLGTLAGAVPMGERARVLCTVRAISCYGFDTCLRVLHGGGTLVLASRSEDVAASLVRDRVEHLTLNPLWVERLLDAAPAGTRPFPTLMRIECAGSHLARPLVRAARARLCDEVWNHYGTTEAGCIGAASLLGFDEDMSEATVRAAPGVEVGAIDAHGAALPPGAHGRLRARGSGFVDRYVDDAHASADAFRDGWHVTADEGSASADGAVRIDGRVGESLNIGGYKVSPRTIEDALRSVRGVRDAVAFGVSAASGIDELWAAVVVGPASARASLLLDVGARLGALAPRVLVTVDAIPRNDAGKVCRDELVASARAAQAAGTA
jgi:long-chain acyl-CoA synthetase